MIRCKDCKYGRADKNGRGDDVVICENPDAPWLGEICVLPNWYCADAEIATNE